MLFSNDNSGRAARQHLGYAEGMRLEYHIFPQTHKGGLSYYPLSGVVNGAKASSVSIDLATNGIGGQPILNFDLSDGLIKLDGTEIEVNSGSYNMTLETEELTIADDGATNPMFPAGYHDATLVVPVFINPRRFCPIFDNQKQPSAASDWPYQGGASPVRDLQAGDKLFQVLPHYNFDDFMMIRNVWRWNGSSWINYNHDIVFESPIEGKDHGHNNLPFNRVFDTPISAGDGDIASVVSYIPEKKVYHKTVHRPDMPRPGHAYLRKPASLWLADIRFDIASDGKSIQNVDIDHRNIRTQLLT